MPDNVLELLILYYTKLCENICLNVYMTLSELMALRNRASILHTTLFDADDS